MKSAVFTPLSCYPEIYLWLHLYRLQFARGKGKAIVIQGENIVILIQSAVMEAYRKRRGQCKSEFSERWGSTPQDRFWGGFDLPFEKKVDTAKQKAIVAMA